MGKDYLGAEQRKVRGREDEGKKETVNTLDEADIEVMKAYKTVAYQSSIRKTEAEIQAALKCVDDLLGIKESDTGLAHPNLWDLEKDEMAMVQEHPLQVARVTKILPPFTGWADKLLPPLSIPTPKELLPGSKDKDAKKPPPRYIVQMKGSEKRIMELSPALYKQGYHEDIKEGTRVGVEKTIQLVLPAKVDPTVAMMQVEDKPDVTYADIGGCKEQLEQLREVLEMPMLEPQKLAALGIDPPKGVMLYGPPGTGKTLCARAVANRTDATFINVVCSELVQRYVGEGGRLVRELFDLARSKPACIIFFDEIDAIGTARFDDGAGGDNEVQRTLLELLNQLDGFDNRGNIKVLLATNRPDTLDPALVRPGRVDRRIEFALPDVQGRAHIFNIYCKQMPVARNVRFDLLARLTPNTTPAEIRSVSTEAAIFAIRQRRKLVTEAHFLAAITKVITGYAKFSATPKYLTHN